MQNPAQSEGFGPGCIEVPYAGTPRPPRRPYS